MVLDDLMCKVIADLEYCIGSECYNPHSYDGWNDIEGCEFRYPVNVPVVDETGEATFVKVRRKINGTFLLKPEDITPNAMTYMKYKFGSNELFVGMGIRNILDYLEERYNLDFHALEEQLQNTSDK